ncbi:hypothetical protein [uncultured Agrobacterium sp.]|uniref:hypothetical protein n=1 Tax=uncultured Agrobacterium sp. TaxID=157277 RepID=UPI0025846D9E|nr:hypothetical protein [uncultured Agrobacterium sp.]
MSDDFSGKDVELDLFGKPIEPIKDRRGRPSFGKSKENQELVCLLRAAGWTQARIAGYLQCDEKTLRKNFSRELQEGADQIEGMALEVTLKKMKSGNSVAISRIFDIIEKGAVAIPISRTPEKKPEEKVGKKEAADRDAHTAHEGTPWATLLQ